MLAQKERRFLSSRLVQLILTQPEPLLFHAEVVRRNGVAVGDVRAGSYGHTLGGAVGLAMVRRPLEDDMAHGPEGVTKGWLDAGEWQVEIGDRLVPAKVSLRPLFDPKSERIKA